MAYKRSYAQKRWGTKRKAPYKKAKPMTAATVAKIARKAVIKVAEPKHYPRTSAKVEMNHNVFNSTSWAGPINEAGCMPSQGYADDERVGDQIITSGFKLKLLIGQKADRPNVTFKIYVLEVPKGTTYSYNNWFENMSSNILLDSPNKDFVKVIATHTWKPHDGSMDNATDEYVYTRSLWVPYKRKIKFGPGDAVRSHNQDDLWFIIGAFDAYGTTILDNIAYYQMVQQLHYRDP